jgi:hypothetical protein
MKKTLLLIMALVGIMVTLNCLPRNLVVVEVGTGTWCQFCPGAAMGCHDLLANNQPVAVIKNHNGDNYANTYSNARNSFYAITGYPTAEFDGLNPTVGGSNTSSMYSNYLPKVTARMAVPSHYSLSAVGSQNGNVYTAAVTVAKPEDDTNTNVKLHGVLTESGIPQVWFNQTTVENVNRIMSPDQNGTLITLATGETTTVNLNFTPNASWNVAEMEVVFFLQNMTSKEILQGVKYSLASLVGAYPVNYETIAFPEVFVTGSSTIPVTITNFAATTATGTIAISNPVFSSSISNFSIPATQSVTFNVTFTPPAAQTYNGNMTITSNLYNHPDISIPLSGTGFNNAPPVASDVVIQGPPVLYQPQTGAYVYTDPDNNTEGTSTYKWYRIVNNVPQEIAGATTTTYNAVDADLGLPIAFQVTPVDSHGMAGTPIMSTYTIPIEVLPAPQNFQGQLNPPDTVVLTWERPAHYPAKAMVGYRVYRNGLTISTIVNPSTLTFTDTYVPVGTHEYTICTMFNNPYMLSGPSAPVTIIVGSANDDPTAIQTSVNAYPNPFSTNAAFSITSKAGADVQLSIFNIKGQLVKNFKCKTDPIGNVILNWDGTDSNAMPVDVGIYYFRMNSNNQTRHGKIILMK